MYCSSCGTAVTPGLSYCNRCGAGVHAKEDKGFKILELPESLVWAIVSVSVGGLGVLIGLLAVMKESLNFSTQLITLFALLFFWEPRACSSGCCCAGVMPGVMQ